MDGPLVEDASSLKAPTWFYEPSRPAPTRSLVWLTIGALGLALVPFVLNGQYARFWADDYCAADSVQAYGLLGAQQNWYETWTGRYTSVFFTDLLVSLGVEALPFYTAALLGVWLFCLWWALRELGRWLLRRDVGLLALLPAELLLLAYVGAMANHAESLYWVSGAANYTLPFVFLTLFAGVVARAARQRDPRRLRAHAAAGFLLATIAAGFSETNLVWQTLVLLLATAGTLLLAHEAGLRLRLGTVLGAGLAGSFLGGAIVWLAPGNDVRQAGLGAHPPLLDALSNGLRDGADVSTLFLREPTVLIVGLAAAVAAFQVTRPSEHRASPDDSPARDTLVALALMIMVAGAVFATGHYFLRNTAPERGWVTTQVTVIATVSFVGWRIGAYARSRLPIMPTPRISTMAAVAVSAALVSVAISSALGEFGRRDALSATAAAWDARDAQIGAARASGEMNLVVAALVSESALMDVTRSPATWSNACIAGYYDIETIRS